MNNKIQCPNCGHNFDVEEALSGKLEEQFRKEFEEKTTKQAEHFNAEKLKLEEERKSFLLLKDKEAESILEKVKEKVAEEKLKIAKSTEESFQEKLKSLEEENEKRKEENKSLRIKEVELLKKESLLKEEAEGFKLQAEKEMLLRQGEIEEKARIKERESFELEKVKLLKQIDDNKKLAEEMKRKAEQSSMQMQGEVQELALEELLAKSYPFDSINEVPKGVRGADAIQTVINVNQKECGKIVYESKRTKAFSRDWIEKLKQDQAICKADIAVIVTETMPSDMNRFGESGGVWICTFQEVKSLSYVLREMLIRTNSAMSAQDNKGDKMELLYNYLTGTEFVQTVERIVENYDGMLSQLNSEKKAMTKIWAQREKQIWVVQENIATLFGSIKGIAGNALGTTKFLELPDGEIED
ncbi:MAG: Caldesmon [Ignavibacteriales bacterium CG18_big_fil_WC_8_21_14_2_50_31_20]|nr:MAG: Caldesmon [Ignavibacteriales bacterium CG18_big_fil_WC_8_21_14_2_50_31_20]